MTATTPDAIRVLAVEHDPEFERQIETWLDRNTEPRFQVTPAAALARDFEAGGFDVMLLDLSARMPRDLDTLECAREIASNLPIVVLAPAHEALAAKRAIRSGADHFLVKGCFGAESLAATLLAAIDGRRHAGAALGTAGAANQRLQFRDRGALLEAFARSQRDPWVESTVVDLPNQILSLRVAQDVMSRPGARTEWFERFQRISQR